MPSSSKAWKAPTRARVLRIRDRLREVYGIPLMGPHGDPIAELILTVLSQSTNDRNRDVAYLRLRERFSTWEHVRDAPVAEVEEAIRPGGISKVKSARIQAILRAIAENPGGPEGDLLGGALARLDGARAAGAGARLPHRAARASGARRPRVCCCSPTACATCQSTRTSRVWGCAWTILRPGAPFEVLHDEMLALTPPGQELELHVNLLRHGRRTCHARSPACEECALARMCPSRKDFA